MPANRMATGMYTKKVMATISINGKANMLFQILMVLFLLLMLEKLNAKFKIYIKK